MLTRSLFVLALALPAISLPSLAREPLAFGTPQLVLPPRGVEGDKFALKARSLPILYGLIGAPAWVLMDADSGRVLAGRDIDRKMFPASTTKTMTTLLAVESGRMDETFRIGPNPPQVGEASVYLLQGERLKLRDLVKAALIRSANDSCVAIAEAVSGSVPRFAQRMNERARELGALNTHFVNPHGLHDPKHYTTARDLALIARQAMSRPEFARIARIRETNMPGSWKMGGQRLLLNRNRLLFRWEVCDGVKTGYTRQAGHCLIASATQRGPDGKPWRLISVVLKSPDSWSDSYNVLMHEGFEKFAPQTLAPKDARFTLQSSTGALEARLAKDVRAALLPGEQPTARVVVERPLIGLRLGDRAGRVEWSVDGRAVARAPLFATLDAPAEASPPGAPGSSPQAPGMSAASVRERLREHRHSIGAALLLAAVAMALAALRSLWGQPPGRSGELQGTSRLAGSSEAPLNTRGQP